MLASSAVSFVLYGASLAALELLPDRAFENPYGAELWLFIVLVMLGIVAGNIRMIALPTLVTALIPEDERDKANGLVGMVTGIGFVVTSAISGFLVALGRDGGDIGGRAGADPAGLRPPAHCPSRRAGPGFGSGGRHEGRSICAARSTWSPRCPACSR